MKPPKKLNVFLWILLVFWMSFIFYHSSKSASDSLNKSGQLIGWIAEKTYQPYQRMDEYQKSEFIENWQIPFRKLAHFFEYMIFGFLVSLAVGLLPGKPKVLFALLFVFWMLYAATDEVHQAYVPGRKASVIDFFIDSAGALAGIIAANSIFMPIKTRRARQMEMVRYNQFRKKNIKPAEINSNALCMDTDKPDESQSKSKESVHQ